MKVLSHQLALFGVPTMSFGSILNSIISANIKNIAFTNYDENIVRAQGIPDDIPRVQIGFVDGVRVNFSKSRFDILSQSLNSSLEMLAKVFNLSSFKGVRRYGSIYIYGHNQDIEIFKNKIASVFNIHDTGSVYEIGAKTTKLYEMNFENVDYKINHLQSIELGVVNDVASLIYTSDINSHQNCEYQFDDVDLLSNVVRNMESSLSDKLIFKCDD